ncbi:hypothetical protein CPLU01_14155 [Colletotrichum plurivorum]|uniref:Uncharacterized protein n=1 Tax=Colletotrichum plurivorum TaxID=2175906 RepID=A0A8H6JMJ9_9PEZI|nr:hypothetical protein CPLU01_14155 [Colletotrichum plurivorum]
MRRSNSSSSSSNSNSNSNSNKSNVPLTPEPLAASLPQLDSLHNNTTPQNSVELHLHLQPGPCPVVSPALSGFKDIAAPSPPSGHDLMIPPGKQFSPFLALHPMA